MHRQAEHVGPLTPRIGMVGRAGAAHGAGDAAIEFVMALVN
jgi:hypothetical protein